MPFLTSSGRASWFCEAISLYNPATGVLGKGPQCGPAACSVEGVVWVSGPDIAKIRNIGIVA
ncbi:MAG: hypothetical protein ACREJL_09800, partial [Candidatus Methylomirabilales bacterium]